MSRPLRVPFARVGAEVMLETLSHSPRVFSLMNFMDDNEADQIIEDALGMTQEEYRLKVCLRLLCLGSVSLSLCVSDSISLEYVRL